MQVEIGCPRELQARSSPDRHLDVFAFQDSGSDLNVYIVNALSTGNGRLKHDQHEGQKQRFIDKDHLLMTEDREAEMRLQGIELLGQRKGKWEGNASLGKVLDGKERIPSALSGRIALINQTFDKMSNRYRVLTGQSVFGIYMGNKRQ